MTDIYQIAGIGMFEGQRRLEAISRNSANAASPGYRRNVAVGLAFDLLGNRQSAAGQVDPARPMTVSAFAANTRPGAMMSTGRPLDVAIDADDQYFGLTDGNLTWLTRAGSFRVNSDGILVGADGLRVVGTQGDIHLPGGDIKVSADGQLLSKGEVVASLRLFQVDANVELQAGPGVLLKPTTAASPAKAPHVRGGMLESSNTDSTREMIDAITVSRQFESLSRVIQGYDDALGQALQKLGSF